MRLNLNDVERRRLVEKTEGSQVYFNPVSLFFYDTVVYKLVSRFFWGCSTISLVERYQKLVDARHLEVGVGTGYLIDYFNPVAIDLTLMDLSESCLKKSAKRLVRYSPKMVKNNILQEYNEPIKPFLSIGLNYVMHCVAGDFSIKSIAFKNLKLLLDDEGVLFGVTVLNTTKSSIFAKGLMYLLNKIGVFNNTLDTILDLKKGLEQHFNYVDIETSSSAVLFFATDSERAFLVHKAAIK